MFPFLSSMYTTINREESVFYGAYLYAEMIKEANFKFNTFYYLGQSFHNKICLLLIF